MGTGRPGGLPAYTSGLDGQPNEIKLKYLGQQFRRFGGPKAQRSGIRLYPQKDKNLVGNMASQGTTPRRLPDLIGSFCDLLTGSGDKGTPIVLIQGYFDNYAS